MKTKQKFEFINKMTNKIGKINTQLINISETLNTCQDEKTIIIYNDALEYMEQLEQKLDSCRRELEPEKYQIIDTLKSQTYQFKNIKQGIKDYITACKKDITILEPQLKKHTQILENLEKSTKLDKEFYNETLHNIEYCEENINIYKRCINEAESDNEICKILEDYFTYIDEFSLAGVKDMYERFIELCENYIPFYGVNENNWW